MTETILLAPRVAGESPLKREQAYEAIRRAIIRSELAPSTVIDESALCQHLGMGRTPVHDALQRLQHEGLVRIFPRRGMIVAPIDMLEARFLTEARLMWEPNVARLAAAVGTSRHWDALAAVLDEAPSTFATVDDAEKGSIVNWRFHRGIAEATGNPCILELAARHGDRRLRIALTFFRHGVYAPLTGAHYEILAALREGDGNRAADLMTRHISITQAREAIVQMRSMP